MGKNDTKSEAPIEGPADEHVKVHISEEPEQKCFLEFNLELVLHTSYSNKEVKINEINSLITQVLGKEDAIHMSANVSIVSEDNMIFPLSGPGPNFEN
jgi:hypothetical protein